MMTHYEREVNNFTNDSSKPLAQKQPADREREKSYVNKKQCDGQILIKGRYTLAEDLNKQLDDLSRNLSQMIDEVNRLSTSSYPSAPQQPGTPSAAAAEAASQMPDDPINQLSAILGAHLRALNSIDGNAGKLESKVAELESRMGTPEKRNGLPRR